MQKLKEVKEQISDSESGSSDDNRNSKRYVDGIVAGSMPDPQIFGDILKKKRESNQNYHYDEATGTITQKALDNTRHKKTKLIIT